MSEYEKKYTILLPIKDYDKQMQDWIANTFGVETMEQFVRARDSHESVVKEADIQGDRVVFFHRQGEETRVEIHWRSDEIHQMYLNRISPEDNALFSRMWNEFHTYLGTGHKF
jgi:hypothetical protein